jgi:HEAT repeat protein
MAVVAAKKLPPFLIGLMALAVLLVGAAALRPVIHELRLTWKLSSPEEAEWRSAAEQLIEHGGRTGLARAIETALIRDPKGFDAWQTRLFARRRRDARWALPAYEACLRHRDAAVRRAAIDGLYQSDWRRPEAVPVVAGALESSEPVLRWQAGYVLGTLGPGAAAAAPALIKATRDPDEKVRWAAVCALGKMAPAAPGAIPALVQAVQDPSVLVAIHAAGALGDLGPRAAAAVPALLEAFRKGDQPVKIEAAKSLGALGRSAREALPVLLGALNRDEKWKDQSPTYVLASHLTDELPVSWKRLSWGVFDARVDLLEAALRLGPDAGDVLPCLLRLVRDPCYEVRQAAAAALGRIGPAASAAIPDLVGHLADRQREERWGPWDISETNDVVAEALGAMGPAAGPALVKALASSEARARYGAALALGKIDPPCAQALAALHSALASDPRLTVRLAAARSLKRFEPATNVVPALLDAAMSGEPRDELTWHHARLDGLAGKEALPSLPSLRQALTGEGSAPCCVAVRLLAGIALESPEPLTDLLGALGARDRSLRRHAAEALGGLSPHAEAVAPRLISVLAGDPDQDVRVAAAGSLAKLGPRAGITLSALWAGYRAQAKEEDRRPWLDALSAVAPGDPPVVELRLGVARSSAEIAWALDGLLKAGPPARSLLPAMERLIEHEDLEVRIRAARALWALDPNAGRVLPIAREALGDDWRSGQWSSISVAPLWPLPPGWENPVREEAARLLAAMGPAGKPALGELISCLDFPGPTVRVLAAEALWRVAGERRLDVLIDAVLDSVPDLSCDPSAVKPFTGEALRILGDMGPAARDAVPSLERLRAAARGELREAAGAALRATSAPRSRPPWCPPGTAAPPTPPPRRGSGRRGRWWRGPSAPARPGG